MEEEKNMQDELQEDRSVAQPEPEIQPEPETQPEPGIQPEPETQPVKRKTGFRRKLSKKILSLILVVLLCAGAGFGGGMAANYLNGGSGSAGNVTIKADDNVNTAEAIAKKVLPSVVGISTSTKVTYQSWNGQETGYTSGVGTGIIVDSDGYILTNSHVISDGKADTIKVELYDGTEKTGKVLWYDSTIDLAIVKIDATGLTAAELGDSDSVQIGAYAVAIGNPLGLEFERSVTVGVISGLNRSITIAENQNSVTMDNLIQTDAAINAGNSGGPLLNATGQVIGINSAKAQDGEGLGFAIPINTAIPIVESVIKDGSFQRVYLGSEGVSVSEYLASNPDVNLGTETGVYINDFLTDSPAKAAGIEKGDVITAIDGDAIDNMSDLISKLLQYKNGDKVKVTIVRDGHNKNFTVALTTKTQ